MSNPWVTIVGLSEDGLAGLPSASLTAINGAEIIIGGQRHLDLVGAGTRGKPWPIPFSIEPILAEKGKSVVVLTSGDPFWFGAGSAIAARLDPSEFRTLPAPSVFSLIAARLGWALQSTVCIGLHAAPFEGLISHLHQGTRIIATLRDAAAPQEIGRWLTENGFGASILHIAERIGGPNEHFRTLRADEALAITTETLVACAIEVRGKRGLPRGFGLPDSAFASDGQITKRPIRAITLSTLAPRPHEILWDLGAGSGSISAEWCLAGGRAEAVELRVDRAENIRENARRFGIEGALTVRVSSSIDALTLLPAPDAVFIGGGANAALIEAVVRAMPFGSRLVINGVTLETESLLMTEHANRGGALMRIDIAEPEPLGRLRGWKASRPVLQWSWEK